MRPWSTFFPDMRHDLPGIDEFTLTAKLRTVARDYLRDTLAWRVSGVQMIAATVPGLREYVLLQANDRQSVEIITAKLGREDLRVARPGEDEEPVNDEDQALAPSVRLIDGARIVFTPAPATVARLVGTVAYTIPENAPGLDDAVYAQCREGIRAAAFQQLMMQPDKSYTNPGLASYYGTEATRQALFDRTAAGGTRAALRVRPC